MTRQIDEYLPKSIIAPQPRTLEEAIADADLALAVLKARLASHSAEDLQRPVAPGKWSPAEFADHLALTADFLARALERAARNEALVDQGKGLATDDGRLVAPGHLLPRPGRSRREILEGLEDAYDLLARAVRRLGATGRAEEVVMTHGHFGPITAVEVALLSGVHIHYHLGQFPD